MYGTREKIKNQRDGQRRMTADRNRQKAKKKKAQTSATQLKPNKYGFIELPPYGISPERYEALRRGQ
jgi:hypothetical protein